MTRAVISAYVDIDKTIMSYTPFIILSISFKQDR